MLTLILGGSLLLIFALLIEKSTATCVLLICCETMILLNFSGTLLDGVPAFLAALIGSTVCVLVVDSIAD